MPARIMGGVIRDTLQRINQLGLDNSSARLLPRDTICLSRTASVGYVVKMGCDMATSQDFVTWSCTEALDPDFLMQALLAEGEDIRRFGEGSTHTTIYFPEVKAFNIALPPLPEQRRIVAKIDSLTGKSRRARDHLDHIPRLVAKYKQAVLAAAFRSVSSGGPRRKLGDLAEFITSGSRGWAKYYSDHGPLFIRVANVMRGDIGLSFSDTQHVSPPIGAEGQRTRVHAADIVITITADLGRVGLISSDLGDAYVSQHVALVRLHDRDFGRFIAWYLASKVGQQQMLEKNRGMTRAGLGLDDIRNVMLPLPSVADQRKTIELIEATHAWIDRLAAEATSARHLIDRLDQAVLAKAFQGELVPQDPADEPTSALLARIRAERADSPGKAERRSRGRRAR